MKHGDIVELTSDRHDELVLFLNRAFNSPTRTTWLPPGFEINDDKPMPGQYAILDNGRIIASAALIPLTWRLGERTLQIANIANVAVDPDYRSQGLMRKILEHIVGVIGKQKYPLSILGGLRQRYQYQGWERSGNWATFTTHNANFKQHAALKNLPPVTLEPVGQDAQVMAQLAQLHAAQRVRCDRPQDFFGQRIVRRGLKPLAARDETGKLVGYVLLHNSRSIRELVVDQPLTALRIGKALACDQPADEFEWLIESADVCVIRMFASAAEQMGMISSGNWQIFDWPEVLGSLMSFQHDNHGLAQGSVTINIQGQQTIRLFVEGDKAGCEIVNKPCAWVVEPMALTRLLFGSQPASMVMPLPKIAAILKAWCPLPLSIPAQDRF